MFTVPLICSEKKKEESENVPLPRQVITHRRHLCKKEKICEKKKNNWARETNHSHTFVGAENGDRG